MTITYIDPIPWIEDDDDTPVYPPELLTAGWWTANGECEGED